MNQETIAKAEEQIKMVLAEIEKQKSVSVKILLDLAITKGMLTVDEYKFLQDKWIK